MNNMITPTSILAQKPGRFFSSPFLRLAIGKGSSLRESDQGSKVCGIVFNHYNSFMDTCAKAQ